VATYSTGISVTWNGTAFTEVQELSWSSGGARQGRDVAWSPDQGTVSVTCLGTENTARSNFGIRAALVISGGGAGLTSYAAWESVAVAPERNGVTRYTVTLKLLDDV
jgi:hypothetical protein